MIGLLAEIVTYEEHNEFDENMASVENATFKRDIGPFKIGYRAQTAQLVHNEEAQETWLETLDADGRVENKVRVTLGEYHGS